MDLYVFDSIGDIVESFRLSIKTIPDCFSKLKYLLA